MDQLRENAGTWWERPDPSCFSSRNKPNEQCNGPNEECNAPNEQCNAR